MRKHIITILFASVHLAGNAETLPSWIMHSDSPNITSSCAVIENDPPTAKLVAIAKAKGELAMNNGVAVTGKRMLIINEENAQPQESWSEKVTLTAQYKLNKITILHEGRYIFNNIDYYCVQIKH